MKRQKLSLSTGSLGNVFFYVSFAVFVAYVLRVIPTNRKVLGSRLVEFYFTRFCDSFFFTLNKSHLRKPHFFQPNPTRLGRFYLLAVCMLCYLFGGRLFMDQKHLQQTCSASPRVPAVSFFNSFFLFLFVALLLLLVFIATVIHLTSLTNHR